MFIRMFIFELVPDDDAIWFDTDYGCVNFWDPRAGYDGTFTAVRERTRCLLDQNEIKGSSIMNYFNAGFFIANRQRHAAMFHQACEHGHEWDNKWGDQCIVNRMVEQAGMPIRYLDRRFNCIDFGEAFQLSDVRAIHSSANYPHYRDGTLPSLQVRFCWDAQAMKEMAGFYCVEFGERISNVSLFYDGTTSTGNLWFATSDRRPIFMNVWGNDMEYPVRWRRMG
jgi:hypothetical protein